MDEDVEKGKGTIRGMVFLSKVEVKGEGVEE